MNGWMFPQDTWEFTLPCEPTGQQRARHTARGIAYKSEIQKAREQELALQLLPHALVRPLEGPLELSFLAVMPIPKSVSKKRKQAMLDGSEAHTKTPDVDNLAKQLLDAMTRMRFWVDDRQIVSIHGEKKYGEEPRWEVRLGKAGAGNAG